MQYKIQKITKDDLTYLECTRCGTQDTFKTFDDTDKFKQRTLAGDWELGMESSLTCLTCNRTTPYYNWRVTDYFYE
ncbi:hypothetical protein M1L59_07075 [Acinetobacter schindleri]|uniref:hypothetical protein n=1 Tax=Acinetobacter schindleri TaxID=108981 RepID=UPI00200AAEDC|nr:hypothetical protein [Acinetobacter schindleri]MCK8640472.1 hypothetical protein [Acinetobacter schindleri]